MNHTVFNFKNFTPTFSPLEQCVDMAQIDQAFGINNIVNGLIFQKAINNLHLFFVLAVILLLIYLHTQKKGYLASSLLLFTGVNAMIISIKLVMNLENIKSVIWNFALFFIIFLPLFYSFLKLLMVIVDKQVKKFYEDKKNDK